MLPCLQFAISLFCFRIVINLTNFFALPGIRTQTDHLHGDLDDLVLVVYLKTEAENTRNLTNKITDINSKLPLLFKVHEIWSVDS